jgi:hypothetical protein
MNKKIVWSVILGCVALAAVFLAWILVDFTAFKTKSPPDIKDGGFLSGEPCRAPCFLGIVPNQTKESQAVQLLKNNNLYENCFLFDHESESGLRGAVCSNGRVSVAYFRGTDIIGSIGFRPSQEITVEMIVEKYGEPNAVLVASDLPAEGEPSTTMSLVYDAIYAVVSLNEQEGTTFQLSPTTMIESIGYADPAFPSVEENEFSSSLSSSWHGYGEYSDVSSP